MVAELKKRNIPSGVVIGGSRSTKSALTLAKENNIGVITRELPLAPLLHHELVPKHSIATEEEVNEVLTKYGIRKQQLPWIKASDPVARAIGAKPGDVVKIIRSSPVAGVSVYYRYVVES
ncbi:MAG: DNA-directed RNA polymerase subunit H [Candidatus Odinarchaeota archaeon]|nr:DNA-directed RNA polymerase subunit H [Candidatus Odinarchaeota archaeon]